MIFKREQDTLIKWKTLCNKSCRSCFIESRTVVFVFLCDFISILQVYCLMRPRRQDLNIIFFIFRSCRQLDGRQAPCRRPFLKFFLFGIYFWNFIFFKYKNEKKGAREPWAKGPLLSRLAHDGILLYWAVKMHKASNLLQKMINMNYNSSSLWSLFFLIWILIPKP